MPAWQLKAYNNQLILTTHSLEYAWQLKAYNNQLILTTNLIEYAWQLKACIYS